MAFVFRFKLNCPRFGRHFGITFLRKLIPSAEASLPRPHSFIILLVMRPFV
ncbi:MAG: hypothetical protein ACTS44_01475 [Candidatus Hodgkinia cicadicola]